MHVKCTRQRKSVSFKKNKVLALHILARVTTTTESWDVDDLAKEARLAKKLRQGKITKEEYEAELDGDGDDFDNMDV